MREEHVIRPMEPPAASGADSPPGPPGWTACGTGQNGCCGGKKRKVLPWCWVIAIAGGVMVWRGLGQTASAAVTYQEAAVEQHAI